MTKEALITDGAECIDCGNPVPGPDRANYCRHCGAEQPSELPEPVEIGSPYKSRVHHVILLLLGVFQLGALLGAVVPILLKLLGPTGTWAEAVRLTGANAVVYLAVSATTWYLKEQRNWYDESRVEETTDPEVAREHGVIG